jgi:hypothetical protein
MQYQTLTRPNNIISTTIACIVCQDMIVCMKARQTSKLHNRRPFSLISRTVPRRAQILYLNRSFIFTTPFRPVQTHRTRFDNATRFFDFHWPITLILVWIFQIFRSAITFWVIWSTYLSKFVLVGCFMNFQLLAVYMKSKNLTLYYYYFYYLSISIHGNLVNPYWKLALGRVRCWEIHSDIFSIFPYLY